MSNLNVLYVTNTFPKEGNSAGTHVKAQIESLIEEGINGEIVRIETEKSKLTYLKSMYYIKKLLKKKSYHFIHAYNGFSGLVCTIINNRLPLILSYTGGEILNPLTRWIFKFFPKKPDVTIVKSTQMKKILNRKYIFVIPNGVDLAKFRPLDKKKARNKLGLDPHKKYILFVGNADSKIKGFDLAKKAFKLIKNRNENIEMIVVNGKRYSEMPYWLNSGDVLIMTSKWEGSPNVIKEALSCNLPVVSVDVGDVKEHLSQRKNCYICKRNPQEIAKKLLLTLKNESIDNSSRIYISKLSSEIIAKKIINIYNSTIYTKSEITTDIGN